MAESVKNKIAIIGCGVSGCCIAGLLCQSGVEAYYVVADESDEVLDASSADKKVKPSGDMTLERGPFEAALYVLDPSEGNALTVAQAISASPSLKGAFNYAFLLKPESGWPEDEKAITGSFDGSALIDIGQVHHVNKAKDLEYAVRVAFNFTAHAMTVIVNAIESGELTIDSMKKALGGKVAGFAATSVSMPETLYRVNMGGIERQQTKSGIIFLPEDTDLKEARRIFLGVARYISPGAELQMVSAKGVEPFRIMAILAR